MSNVRFPAGYRVETLRRGHRRRAFDCGEPRVNGWLKTNALQHQEKHLSVTKVLLDAENNLVAYYTLATGQVDFGDLPPDLIKRLPRRALPVAVLAWLGVDQRVRGQRLGRSMLARALRDCYDAGESFGFVAVILDCIEPAANAYYRQWGFRELPGHAHRMFVSWRELATMMQASLRTDSEPTGPA